MIEWIVTSSALIVLVLLLRALVKGRVSPRLRYALWGLVLLRLLVPVSLLDSPVSVMNPVAAQEARLTAPPEGTPVFVSPFAPDSNPYLDSVQAEIINPSAMGPSLLDPTLYTPPEKEERFDWKTCLEGIWLAGTAVLGVFLLTVNLKFYLGLKKRRQPAGKYRGRTVYAADGLSTPCLFGLLRPAVYLTPGLSKAEREHVLAHEYAHFRQGDHIWATLRGVCLALHWYNPLVWLAAYLSRRDCELSCDEGAVRLLGEASRADYGRTLVGLVARRTTPADLACCATTMTGGKSALKERVALLVKRPRTTAVMAVLVAAACVVFAACTFTGAKAQEVDEPVNPVQTEQEPADEPLLETDPAADSSQPAIPENLPTELMDLSCPAEEQGEWLLLAQTPDFDIALYRSAQDDQHVYLRVTNQSFQRFDRDLSGMELLPTLEVTDGDADITVQVLYRRYEGTYFNGTSNEPGIVAEQIFYDWDESAKSWTEWTIGSQPVRRLTADLPALEDLPDALIDVPGASQAPIWKVAELPEDDIAVYYEQETGRGLLRYGDALQALDLGGRAITTPRLLMPVLYFEDFDGDGEKELAMNYNSGSGTGVSVWSLTVFEWDGARWTEHTAQLEEEIINDFNSSRTLALHPDENYATVSFHESRVDVDMDARFGGRTLWKEEPLACEITGAISAYSRESYGLTLTLAGELRPESYHPTTSYAFSYTCCIYYDGDGAFHAAPGWLDAEYRWVPKADGSLITPVFRDILLRFIDQCRAEGMEDLTTERYAICDVNGDGENELLIQRNNTSMAGQVERVYNIYGNELLAEYPGVTYYDNGYAQAFWSHNQGVAGDKLWPYTLYRTTGTGRDRRYTTVATVDGWDRSIRDTYLSYDETVIPFPEEVDKDGDGFVYYLITEAGGYAPVYGTPMDYAEYANWAAVFLGANAVEVAYIPLTEENIALIQSS
jgi:beta-lactamase regulating signal transducer with metallopeptidase domain